MSQGYDFQAMDRHDLKSIAFTYHYGYWRSEEDAYKSFAYQAAAELARRGGYSVPKPALIGDTFRGIQEEGSS